MEAYMYIFIYPRTINLSLYQHSPTLDHWRSKLSCLIPNVALKLKDFYLNGIN